jgi:hypothetical protein
VRETIGDSYVDADFSVLDKMLSELDKGHFVDVGILGDKASKTESGGATVAMVGAVQEFGSLVKKIPKRSFIAMPIQTRQEQIQKAVEGRFSAHLEKGDVGAIFRDIGIAAEGEIQDAFDTRGFGTWAANDPKTVKRKGSDSPLIDKAVLRKSITSKAGVSG